MSVVGLAAVAAAVFLSVSYCLRFIYDYRLSDHAVEVLLFGLIPVWNLPFEEIQAIRKVSWRELGIGRSAFRRMLRVGNRLFGQSVLITRKRGWVLHVVVTPKDADGFVSRIERELDPTLRD